MEEKFGHKKSDDDSFESDNDEGDDGGDGGDVDATAASAPCASDAGGDERAESESDDNHPEPGFKLYYDDRNVRQIRWIQTEETEKDADYVPPDTEANRLKRKETSVRRKKKSRKTVGSSSVQPTSSETVHEVTTTEPLPVVNSATEMPSVTPQADPTHTMASTIRATTSQHSSER
ncbi:hypothetical protein Hdeb2414_s0161g00818631 [Helianthus debilis subsp. tardiflorus]